MTARPEPGNTQLKTHVLFSSYAKEFENGCCEHANSREFKAFPKADP